MRDVDVEEAKILPQKASVPQTWDYEFLGPGNNSRDVQQEERKQLSGWLGR
jgi:hypothetical protein